MHWWTAGELKKDLEEAGCHTVDSFTFTYIESEVAPKWWVLPNKYKDSPISQGIVCRKSRNPNSIG